MPTPITQQHPSRSSKNAKPNQSSFMRVTTGYQLFMRAVLEDMRRKCGGAEAMAQWTQDQVNTMVQVPTSKQLSMQKIRLMMIGKLWTTASHEEKQAFHDMSNKLREANKALMSDESADPTARASSTASSDANGEQEEEAMPVGRLRPTGGGKARKIASTSTATAGGEKTKGAQESTDKQRPPSKKNVAKDKTPTPAANTGTKSNPAATTGAGSAAKTPSTAKNPGPTPTAISSAGKSSSAAEKKTASTGKNTPLSSQTKSSTLQSGSVKGKLDTLSTGQPPAKSTAVSRGKSVAYGDSKQVADTTSRAGVRSSRRTTLVDADAEAELEDDEEEELEGDKSEEKEYPVVGDSAAEMASIGLEKGVEKYWVEVEWEVQKGGKNAKEWMQWFVASVDLRKPIGYDDQKRPRWTISYSKCLTLKATKSEVVFLTADELLDDCDIALKWRKKADTEKGGGDFSRRRRRR